MLRFDRARGDLTRTERAGASPQREAGSQVPTGTTGFVPIGPLWRVEHAFAQLGRWRRLSRCYEGTADSARAWFETAAFGYLPGRV